MTATETVRRVWKSAQLLVGFHVDPKGNRRDQPKVWSPKNATASIHPDVDRQETFVQLTASEIGASTGGDVQVKFRSDKIVVTRDGCLGWEGIVIEESRIAVRVNGMYIRILADGSVSQNPDRGSTLISSDGAVSKDTGDVRVFVSPDGLDLRCRTPFKEYQLTPDGAFERDLSYLRHEDDT